MKISDRVILSAILGLLVLSMGSLAWFKFKSPSKSAASFHTPLSKGVGVLSIDGPILFSHYSGAFGGEGVDAIINSLYDISKDTRIKALVIHINSPGGTVGASQELYNEIEKFKKRTRMPVVISVGDICASGAYWVALSGDRVFANEGSLVGSIGVILSTLDLTEVKNKYGVGMKVVKSGPYKDLFSSWRATAPEEQEILDKLIQDVYGQFVSAVATERHLSVEQVKALADGRILSGAAAKEAKLIDETGGFREAVAYAAKQAHLSGEPELIYQNQDPLSYLIEQLGSYITLNMSRPLTLQ